MPVTVTMPALSPTMEEGTLTNWLVEPGATIQAGDPIAEIETDKATMEVEAIDDGILVSQLVPAGTEGVRVNAPIAVIALDGEDEREVERAAADNSSKNEEPDIAVTASEIENHAGTNPTEVANDETKRETAPAASLQMQEIPDGVEMTSTSVRDALRDAMAEEMRRDETVFLMGEEVAQYQGAYKVSRDLLEEFGEKRVVDTPITEYGFAGLGVGAALNGLRPIVEFMTWNFALQAIDHIVNSAAKTHYMTGGLVKAPIVFRGPNGSAARVAAQHSQDFSALYAHIPGLVVLAPYDSADAKGLLKSAIRSNTPVVFLENEIMYGEQFDVPQMEDWLVPIGKSCLRREGADATLVSYSRMVGKALSAAEILAQEHGIECDVIDLRSLRPLDIEPIYASLRKTNRIVIAEEGWGSMGVGAEIAARVSLECFDDLDHPPLRVHARDVPLPYAENLEKLALPQEQEIIDAVKKASYVH